EVLPTVGKRVDQGATRSENADMLARQLAGLSDDQRSALAVHDNEIAQHAVCAPPEVFAKWLGRRIRTITQADSGEGESREERQRAASEFGMKRRGDGMWQLWGQLDQTRGAELNDVITRAARQLNNGEATANARADALHRLTTRRPATEHTGTDHDPAAVEDDALAGFDPGARMGIGYIVDAATLTNGPHNHSVTQTWDGHNINPADVDHLACDTDLYAILYDELGQPTKVGRTRHAATREQRLQLRGLYDRCPLDGTPFGDCEVHHVNLPWEHGGETELHNLLPISRAWHHRIHHNGWTLKMGPDRSLKLWRPDGQLERAIPPPTPISRE
ncbi:MAG: HNH endonuclease signature motif containing protein, partial [Acidimicrobiales bacterium]